MRKIDQLIDLPYSEMTDEEIELVVEWKASVKARDDAFRQQRDEQRAYNEAMLAVLKTTAATAQNQLDDLVQQALDRLRSVDNGQA